MNLYVSIISEVVEHIECCIGESLQLSELSSRAGISDFHFNRMFKTVAGVTLKQYILGRKLTIAMEQLKSTKKPVIDIAMELGFQYPEVFSRAFKKQFGASPVNFREMQPLLNGTPKARIVERDIINYRGSLALKGNSVFLDTFTLGGVQTKVSVNSTNFKQILSAKTEGFLLETSNNIMFNDDRFYTVVSCSGKENGEYNIFCGKKAIQDVNISQYEEFAVPSGWYIVFIYNGDMFDIQEVFIDDLYKWIMVKEAELKPNGIGMLNIYESNYPDNKTVQILVPVRKPV
ncbi:MAG: AraC family transcriptional regulator [Bacillota bacterium]|nr:AraC family transcriptional regulator [Bacillota bacterium]